MIHVPGESLASLFSLLPSHLNDKCHYTAKKTKKLLESINIIPNDSKYERCDCNNKSTEGKSR